MRLEPVVAQASDWWTSPSSGASYPMAYRIQSEGLGMGLAVRTAVDDQELYFPDAALFNHYEGASTVEGTYQGEPARGYCYVELIGDWSER